MKQSELIEQYKQNGTKEKFAFDGTGLAAKVFEPTTEPTETLIGVTGGPGVPKEHLAMLSRFTEHGYRIVLYDQHNVGDSGNHEYPYDVQTFLNGLRSVASAYDDPVLVGHSWGAMLSLQYGTRYEGIGGVVAIAPLFDTQKSAAIARVKRSDVLSVEEARYVTQCETQGAYGDDRYKQLMDSVSDEIGTKPPVHEFVEELIQGEMNHDMYEEMWGQIEYAVSEDAMLREWSIEERLDSISVPVLLTTGVDDMFGYHDLFVAGEEIESPVQVSVIEEASHTPTWTKPDELTAVIAHWLDT